MIKIVLCCAAVLISGALAGVSAGWGIRPGLSTLWALPFTLLFITGFCLGVWPFVPR